jgi:oligopeptide transport system permease protein
MMGKYVLLRILSGILVIFTIATSTFFLIRALPSGPFSNDKNLPETIRKNIEARYKLDQPLWVQYKDYMSGLLQGDLGPSFRYKGRTVNDFIREGFPVSAILGAIALFFSLSLGVITGVVCALKHKCWIDHTIMFFAVLGVSVPNFILASLLVYVFAYKLCWFPAAMWGTPSQIVLPVLALSSLPLAIFARMIRSSMIEVLQQDFITTARAKGLPEYLIVFRHALKNSLLPIITYLGPLSAAILTGSFIIENIFAIPGLGKHFVSSITNRDYTTIVGVTIFYSLLLVGMNILVDLLYVLIDPRIRLTGRRG